MSKLQNKTAADLEVETMVARMRLTIAEQRQSIAQLKNETALASALLPGDWRSIPIEVAPGILDADKKYLADLAIKRGKDLETANTKIAELERNLALAKMTHAYVQSWAKDGDNGDLASLIDATKLTVGQIIQLPADDLNAIDGLTKECIARGKRIVQHEETIRERDAEIVLVKNINAMAQGVVADLRATISELQRDLDMTVAGNGLLHDNIVDIKRKLHDAGNMLGEGCKTHVNDEGKTVNSNPIVMTYLVSAEPIGKPRTRMMPPNCLGEPKKSWEQTFRFRQEVGAL